MNESTLIMVLAPLISAAIVCQIALASGLDRSIKRIMKQRKKRVR